MVFSTGGWFGFDSGNSYSTLIVGINKG